MSKPTWTIRIDDRNPVHTRIAVFNRGGNAGTLCVNTSDLDDLRSRLGALPILDTTSQGDWIKQLPGHEGEVELHDNLAKELQDRCRHGEDPSTCLPCKCNRVLDDLNAPPETE